MTEVANSALGVVTQVRMIGPKEATALLKRNRFNNRALRISRVERYANDMRNGQWKLNGETIIIDKQGFLNNGQHRLNAVIKANVTIPMNVTEGVDPDVYSTLDQALPRSSGDVLTALGIHRAAAAAAMLRVLLNYRDGTSISATRSNNEIEDAYLAEPTVEAYIKEHASFLSKTHSTVPLSVCFLIHRFGDPSQRPLVSSFIEGVSMGVGLTHGDIRLIYRNRFDHMYSQKGQRPEQGKCWNLTDRALRFHLKGTTTKKLVATETLFTEIPAAPRKVVKEQWGK